jgi:uncharacterized protein (DUF2267 family)
MSTGLDTFDRTVQETNLWLKSLMSELATDDRRLAFTVLRATLHALRDRLQPATAVAFGAQLPMLLRGLFYEGWQMAKTPTKEHHWADFLDHMRQELPPTWTRDTDQAARAVFSVISQRVEIGEVTKIVRFLPPDIRGLWPSVVRSG